MAQPRVVNLPNLLRNPVVALEIAGELEEWASVLEERGPGDGRAIAHRARIKKIKAAANQLAEASEARIGNQAD